MPVSSRLKFLLLMVVVAAILYVLISPLPELAATSTLNFPVLPLIIILIVPNLVDLARTPPPVQITGVWLDEDLPSRNCALLC
ncbi:MAG TPA: hypothetical protein VJS37_05995 [Terriglobales bacterium]|nr:hypothetical protein [Terriglobales bacterium]